MNHFTFALKNKLTFHPESYRKALGELYQFNPPREVYVAYGPAEMGVGFMCKIHGKPDWMLILPLDLGGDCSEIECGFTHGVASRGATWQYIKQVLSHICKQCPFAFEFSYEDDDDPECIEYGYWDASHEVFVVKHEVVPMAEPAPPAKVQQQQQQQATLPPLLSWMRRPLAT